MCETVYIVRTDSNPSGSCQPFSIIIYILMTPCVAACWLLVVTCLHLSIFVMKRNLAYTVNSYLTSITGPYENVNWRGGGCIHIFMFCPRDFFSN